MELQLTTDRIGATQVVSLIGVADVSTVPTLHSALQRHLRAHPGGAFVVDLDQVIALDDAALGVLLGAAGRARESGGDLVVVCSDEKRRARLARTRFDRAVDVRSGLALSVAHDLFHIALPDDWQAAQLAGEYRVSTRGMTLDDVGYIHCSRRHQVEHVANSFYGDLHELLLLTVDPASLDAPLIDEPPAPDVDQLFPHIYGPLPLAAVVDVMVWRRPAGEAWILPTKRH